MAAATDEDVVGDTAAGHLGSGDPVEEGDAKGRAIAADDVEEAVDGADRGGPSILEQFVEQVECVLGANGSCPVPLLDVPLQDASHDAAAHSLT